MESNLGGEHASVLPRLRQYTSDHHQAVEDRLALGSSFTREHYARVLAGFDAFLQAWEPLIREAVPTRMRRWTEEGLRHAQLRHDLKDLGIAPSAPAKLHIPMPTRAAAMGSLYVMEGSALGAHVIAPRLEAEHGFDASHGARYFSVDPKRAATRWRDFRFLLDQEVATPAAQRQACHAAAATFQALLAVFEPVLQEHEARAS